MKLLISVALLIYCASALEKSKEELGCDFKAKFERKGLIQGNNFQVEKVSTLRVVQKVIKECTRIIRQDCLYFYKAMTCIREHLYPNSTIYSWNSELVRSQWVCKDRFHPKSLRKVKSEKEIELFGKYGSCVFQELGVYDPLFDEVNLKNFPAGHGSKYIDMYVDILKECKLKIDQNLNYDSNFFYHLIKCADISEVLKYF